MVQNGYGRVNFIPPIHKRRRGSKNEARTMGFQVEKSTGAEDLSALRMEEENQGRVPPASLALSRRSRRRQPTATMPTATA
jgi:hypothetical protein